MYKIYCKEYHQLHVSATSLTIFGLYKIKLRMLTYNSQTQSDFSNFTMVARKKINIK